MKKYVEQIVIAKPNWCVPAVLEMVLTHHGIKSLSQRQFGFSQKHPSAFIQLSGISLCGISTVFQSSSSSSGTRERP